MKLVKLSKKYKVDDKELDEVSLDFDLIDGELMENMQALYFQTYPTKEQAFVMEMDRRYQRMFAEQITDLPNTFFKKLSGNDYISVMAEVQNFLLS